MHTKLAQLRADKSPQSYLHTVNSETCTSQCPLCLSNTHDTSHFFKCSQVPTQHNTTSLWKKPLEAAAVIQEWESRLASLRDYGMAPPRYPCRRGNNNNNNKQVFFLTSKLNKNMTF